jgi:hypothetical protein
VAFLIGGRLIKGLPHDDGLLLKERSRDDGLVQELDAVSRAGFTSRHLFQVDAQTRYNNNPRHAANISGDYPQSARSMSLDLFGA